MRDAEPHILFEQRGCLGLITLNRPRALNALTHGMCIGMRKTLGMWADDKSISVVVIQGTGPRAFCAGGDIRAMYESGRDKTAAAGKFLADEYRLNALIASYPKPYIALLHGLVMGGGAGLSVHGRYRLAEPTLDFAMPETGIGFVTDIGSSHFLSRCPGQIGIYLGLTGARIGASDTQAIGLVTHLMRAEDRAALLDRLTEGEAADCAIRAIACKPETPALSVHRALIDRCFSAPSVEAILERLDRDGSDFAVRTAQTIRARSPSACKFTFRALRQAREMDLEACLKMEYRIAMRAIPANDFLEGVRARLIDKDDKPRWQPASLAGVSDGDIAGYFASLGARELDF